VTIHTCRLTHASFASSQAGLLGAQPKVVWVGNVPETSANEAAIRLLFNSYGDIRRVYLRKKTSPSMSWCLLMFRASESALQLLDVEPPVVLDATGERHTLLVELPDIEKALTKANPGALGAVVTQALDDELTPGTSLTTRKKPSRRRSAAEIEVRRCVTSDQTTETVSALADEQASKRGQWTKIRSSRVRNKLAVAAMFVQNDDANEAAAKKAIADTMVGIKAEEPEITNTVRALAELYRGEMRGLDYRFKTEASLFRKVMARLDASLAEAALSKAQAAPPTPADILKSILDVLRYTAVRASSSPPACCWLLLLATGCCWLLLLATAAGCC
jgi:hypothetical protein